MDVASTPLRTPQILPVLASLLVQVKVKGGQLSLTRADLEMEMVARHEVEGA